MNLEDLLFDLPLEQFFENYWEQKALSVVSDHPERFSSLFSLASLDQLLSGLPEKRLTLAKQGAETPVLVPEFLGGLSLSALYAHYADGYTLVVNDLTDLQPAVGALCTSLSHTLGARVAANLYATPRESAGFGPHWDEHDVFILQLEGSKAWRVYDSGPELPRILPKTLEGKSERSVREPGEPTMELQLRAGDALYLPRGTVHNAFTEDAHSLHLTLGIYTKTWEQLIIAAVQNAAQHLVGLRRGLPPGYLFRENDSSHQHIFKNLLTEIAQAAELTPAKDVLAEQVLASVKPCPSQHFTQLNDLASLDLDTVVARRLDAPFLLRERDAVVSLCFPGNVQKAPAKVNEAFRFIAEATRFRVGDMPESLGDQSKILLVKHFVSKGFLHVVD
ncbi:JmjC domain-containing protein [Acanthopleuribacter pedis]|uniref:JmjC domain-containing protein n=1 Tax=Acanthopleuribacter pedis TaxID=442870 RepID=A0A8J7QCK9_9BACT|nr:hypothetical protein [Acanthopleuribacter pedis]